MATFIDPRRDVTALAPSSERTAFYIIIVIRLTSRDSLRIRVRNALLNDKFFDAGEHLGRGAIRQPQLAIRLCSSRTVSAN